MQWNVATRRVVRFSVAFAVFSMVAAVFADTLGEGPRSLQAQSVVAGSFVIVLLGIGVMLGLLIVVPFWIYTAIGQTREHDRPAYGHLGYWGVAAFSVLFVAAYVVPGGVYAVAAVRVLGSALLVAGVLHTRTWLRRRSDPGRPYAADRYSLVTGGEAAAPLAAQPTADDWNQWDPDVDREIERRRYRG